MSEPKDTPQIWKKVMTPMAKDRQIIPTHHSLRGGSIVPYNMERAVMPRDMKEHITKVALSIFTDSVNAGQTFQNSILAIYLSGLQHGAAVTKETTNV